MAEIQEIEELLQCAGNHDGRPICWVLKDKTLPVQERLLCDICANQMSALVAWHYQNKKQSVMERQINLSNSFKLRTQATREKILAFSENIEQMKNAISEGFDSLVSKTEDWFRDITNLESQINSFKLLEKFDPIYSLEEENMNNILLLQNLNQSYFVKFRNHLERLGIQDIMGKCQRSFYNLFQSDDLRIQQTDTRTIIVTQQEQGAPYVQNLCPHHNKNIIYVNTAQNVTSESRVACVQCERTNQIPVTQFMERWQNYLHSKGEKINEYRNSKKDLLDECVSFIHKIAQQQNAVFDNLIHRIQVNIRSGINFQYKNTPSSETQTLISMAEELSLKENDFLNDVQENYKNQLQQAFLDCELTLQQLVYEQSKSIVKIREGFRRISYKEVGQVSTQNEQCNAICFNRSGTVMISGFGKDVKIWEFKDGILENQKILKGYHQNLISCLLYSRKEDWFVSGSYDFTVQFWKKIKPNKWIVSKPKIAHDELVSCLIMNQNEDEIISGSWDKSIKIWKVYNDLNAIQYQYSLKEHQGYVLGISLSDCGTTLVSCGGDNRIILWIKIEKVWQFSQIITQNYYCHRISFIGNELIILQQANKGISRFFKKINNGTFSEEENLTLELNNYEQDDSFFPTIYNYSKNLVIQKHNKFVYLLKHDFLGRFILAAKIDCECDFIVGGLTQDGQYLVLWSQASAVFKTYKISNDFFM